MYRKNLLLIVFVFIYIRFLPAQNQANIWYFGDSIGLDFNTDPPTPLYNGSARYFEQCAAISDKNTGKLLFYSDGVRIYDSTHNIMLNGSGILSCSDANGKSSAQGANFIPVPGSDSLYMLITVDCAENSGLNQWRYSVIDKTLNGGLGGVIPGKKNILLASDTWPTAIYTERFTAIQHCNGNDVWLVTHRWGNNTFEAQLLTTDGVIIDTVFSSVGLSATNIEGCLKLSPDGSKLAMTRFNSGGTGGSLEIFDFDNSTGILSNAVNLSDSAPTWIYYAEFSPNSRYLYCTSYAADIQGLQQYDLYAGTVTEIKASKVTLYERPGGLGSLLGQIQLAPNKKIYVTRGFSDTLAVINEPDQKGASSNFNLSAIGFNGKPVSIGLPNFYYPKGFFNPAISSIGDTTICLGESVVLTTDSAFGYNYFWSPGALLNDSTIRNPIASPYDTTVFFLQAIKNCDTIFDTVVIYVNHLPAVDAGQDVSICIGENTVLGASGGDIYTWEYDASLSDTEISNPVAEPILSKTYKVRAIDASTQCENIDSVNVTINDLPLVDAGIPIGIMCGNFATLNAMASSGNAPYSYKWIGGDTTAIYPNVSAGLYEVVVTDANDCENSDTVRVYNTNSDLFLSLSQDTFICPGQSVDILVNVSGGVGAITYDWNGLLANTPGNKIVSPNSTTSYVLTISDTVNCSQTANVTITITPDINISVSSEIICRGESIILNAGGGTSYSWSPSSGLSNANSSNPSGTPDSTTEYKVVVSDNYGCVDSAFAMVMVLPPPIAEAGLNDTVCRGDMMQLNASGGTVYQWSPDTSLSDANIYNPVASPNINTVYYVTVSNGNCSAVDSVLVFVMIPEDITIMPDDTTIMPGSSVQLQILGGQMWSWVPTTYLDSPDSSNPISTPEIDITYYVATVDNLGCNHLDSITIYLEEFPFYVPNAFSPDGDGVNDYFHIVTNNKVKSLTVSVYSILGEKVFESDDMQFQWDGLYRNEIVQGNILSYKALFTLNSGITYKRFGNVTIAR